MIRLENVKIRENLNEKEVIEKACKQYKINFKLVENYTIFRKSIDARNKEDIFYNYTIDLKCKDEKNIKRGEHITYQEVESKVEVKRKSKEKPIIVGAGPAGLFCALTLVEYRQKEVEKFINEGKLNPSCNIQFGEGGAGTFSDGKLTTSLHNPLCKKVLKEFVKFGAPNQILYVNKPHIGTDYLIKIIANIRNYIISKGGEFIFNEKVTNL